MKFKKSKEPDSHRFFRLAIKAAKKSDYKYNNTFYLGAVIFKGKRVFAVGSNTNKEHPTYGSGMFKSIHAEGRAIMKAVNRNINLKGATILVYRKNHKLAKPCKDCQKLIKKYGIKKVIYSSCDV